MRMERVTKKGLAAGMYAKGLGVDEIAALLHTAPSYVANSLIEQGVTPSYVDLYTSTGPQNRYAARLSGALRFKDMEAARASVARINEVYEEYAARRDRCGMHQCEVVALTGKNRAEGIGKWREAQVFANWLADHLHVQQPEPPVIQLVMPIPADEDAPPAEAYREPALLAA